MSVHQNFGFPPGYFVIRSTSCNRLLDVSLDDTDDSAEIILWPEKESSLVESAISTCDFSVVMLTISDSQRSANQQLTIKLVKVTYM